MSLLSRKVWWAAQIGSFWPKVDVFYRSKWIMEGGDGGVGDHIKMNFEYFQMQKWIFQTTAAEKVDEKNGVICLVSFLS